MKCNAREAYTFLPQSSNQVFQYDLIIKAHQEAADLGDSSLVTDDASLMERLGFKVTVVEPTGLNFKVTTEQDMRLLEALLKGSGDA